MNLFDSEDPGARLDEARQAQRDEWLERHSCPAHGHSSLVHEPADPSVGIMNEVVYCEDCH